MTSRFVKIGAEGQTRLPPNTPKMCAIHNCDKKAEWVVCLEFSYMRGEDEVANFCTEHRNRGMKDPGGMAMSTRDGSWK